MRVRIGKGSCVPAKGNARKVGILIANQTKNRDNTPQHCAPRVFGPLELPLGGPHRTIVGRSNVG